MTMKQLPLPRYRSHKIVQAIKIESIDTRDDNCGAIIYPEGFPGYAEFDVSQAYMQKHGPAIGGYYIRYSDGYESWSPPQPFEEGYTPVFDDEATAQAPAPAKDGEYQREQDTYRRHEIATLAANAVKDGLHAQNVVHPPARGPAVVKAYTEAIAAMENPPAPPPTEPYPYPTAETSTKVYSDGTTVTGAGQLPDLSPAQQDKADNIGIVGRAGNYLKNLAHGAMAAQQVSQQISQGPRVTIEQIESEIAHELYFTGLQGWEGATDMLSTGMSAALRTELGLITFCVLIMRNGFKVSGESVCVAPENFNAEKGKAIARANAVDKLWPILGYELKTAVSGEHFNKA